MAKVRSPNYPQIDLGAALGAVRKAFEKDHRNKMSAAALAKHLGHDSLSGPASAKIGALRGFGLIDGSGDELRVSDDAVTILMAPQGAPERAETLQRLAIKPSLFRDIRKEFATLPSSENLEYWLVKRNFTPAAAKIAAKTYLASARFAESESGGYTPPPAEREVADVTPGGNEIKGRVHTPPLKPEALQEVFNLDEGPVTLTFPATLSEASYQDLADHLEIFLRKAKRRADEIRRYKEMTGDVDD